MDLPHGWLPRARVLGVDLAWGTRNPDGFAEIIYDGQSRRGEVLQICLSRGDADLLAKTRASEFPTLLAVDAPLVCRNETGSRPVDRETHVRFGRQHAGCHPANLNLVPRPAGLLRRWRGQGYRAHWSLQVKHRLAIEVYPHPAMVRWFSLSTILKYKRSPISNRRSEFRRYQSLLIQLLESEFSWLAWSKADLILDAPWTKDGEDQLDAFFCSLIGLWHLHYRGTRSQILGDAQTGFLVVPY
ncbi:MAG: DUF429 domain-containing protein [Verrucomicrobiota bacterium]